jgi:hypothetical protein
MLDDPRFAGAHLAALGQAEGENGYSRAPFLVELNPSGARGAPLTALRRFRVVRQPPSVGDQAVAQQPAVDLTRIWPWIFPPDDVYPIWRVSPTVSVPAGGTSSLITIVEIPRGYRGVVKKFGHNTADFTNIQWIFLVKGAPRDPMIFNVGQFGTLTAPVDLPGAGVMLYPGDDFIVQAKNVSGAAIGNTAARVDLYWWRT